MSHTTQIQVYKVPQQTYKFNPVVNLDGKRMKYDQSIFDNVKKYYTHKNGQRKLLLTELLFLNQVPDNSQIVYVGAADGTHTQFMAQLYPTLKFDLYDPRDFDVKETSNIKIFQQYFTDDDCSKYQKNTVYFISDIRSNEYDGDQQIVEDDMNFQLKWIELLQPKLYSLKFKLNYNKKLQNYLDGVLYHQPWTNPWSIETRLIGSGYSMKTYNCRQYEERLFYFNVFERYQKHSGQDGLLDTCFDCCMESYCIDEYLKAKKTKFTREYIYQQLPSALLIKQDVNVFNQKSTQTIKRMKGVDRE